MGPASVMVGTIVQGNRLATAQGRDIGIIDMDTDSNKTVSVSHDYTTRVHHIIMLL